MKIFKFVEKNFLNMLHQNFTIFWDMPLLKIGFDKNYPQNQREISEVNLNLMRELIDAQKSTFL